MRIAHIAIWTQQLEVLRDFYTLYFGGVSNKKYTNSTNLFESYFIKFDDGTQLELMRKKGVDEHLDTTKALGITHIAFYLGSKEAVLTLTERLHKNGFTIVGEPRTSGDGYFESVILDPDGNRIELVA